MTILIADDDPIFTRLFSTQLKAKGFKVTIAADAMQATMVIRKSKPDAVFLDINMPGGTGLEVLKNLRISTTTTMIPVIVMSASEDPELPMKVKERGADEFLSKPVDFEEAYRDLCRLLGVTPEESS